MSRLRPQFNLPSKTEVLIIGGGPTGLVASTLLSQLGISNVVVERQPNLPNEPKAHVIRKRPVEIFKQLGIMDEIYETQPKMSMDYIVWCSSLAGKEIGRLDLKAKMTPDCDPGLTPWLNMPQNLLQPILYKRANAEFSATILHGASASIIENSEFGIRAEIDGGDNTENQTIEAKYAIAADGAGSRTRKALDIEMIGNEPTGRFFMVHFKADLRPMLRGRSGPIYWILNPEAIGGLIVHEPEKSYVFMTPVTGDEGDTSQLPNIVRTAIGQDIPFDILSTKIWVAHGEIAERYREKRVLLIGDAAHRFPPTGGLGLNTGVIEAHNLAWKLALVLRGKAEELLLDSYEQECRPAAYANAQESLANQARLLDIINVLAPFDNLESLNARLIDISAEEQSKLDEAIEAQRSHFDWDGMMPRCYYAGQNVKIDRTVDTYEAFSLVVDDDEKWNSAATKIASELGVNIIVHVRKDGAEQARLVRPDGFVIWMDDGMDVRDPVSILRSVMRNALHLQTKKLEASHATQ